MAELPFHEKHFPTFMRLPQKFTRPVHWTAHLGMVIFITLLVMFAGTQVVALANLRRAVAVREATSRMETPYGSVSEPSLLGDTVVCEPALLRWYYGTEPLCQAVLDASKAAR